MAEALCWGRAKVIGEVLDKERCCFAGHLLCWQLVEMFVQYKYLISMSHVVVLYVDVLNRNTSNAMT